MNKLRAVVDKRDDGFALLSVILLMTVVTFFGIMMLGLVLAQTGPTLLTNKNSRTQGAAQAGLDAAASQLRNAESVDGSGLMMGDIHKLPCTVQGAVDGTGGSLRYAVAVQYFVSDPAGHNTAWRATNALTCYTGTGTNGGVRSVPHFAIMSSQGFDDTAVVKAAAANRVLEATYTFQLTTRKVSGGMIMDANSTYCLVADSASAGSYIRYKLASSNACASQTDQNSWSWRDDYMIHLTSTDKDGKIPLCLTGRATGTAPIAMTLVKCYTGSTDPSGQRWSWTGAYTWQGQNAANTAYANTYVVNQDSAVGDGDLLSVSTSTANVSLTPLGAVGKGAASYATHQVVNQNYFGRCLDVTNTNIYYSYMIAYPCKQDPSGAGAFDWNHKWYYAEPGDGVTYVNTTIRVNNGSDFCLVTASSTGLKGSPVWSGYNSKFVRFDYSGTATSNGAAVSNCVAATTVWKRYGYSTDPKLAYTFVDSNGLCLSAAGPKITQDGGAGTWTSIVVSTCDGSDNQKWNVPDIPVSASLNGYQEVTGRTGG